MIKKLAIIDDDELYVFITSKMIEKSQLVDCIDVFGNGQEGIEFIENNASDSDLLPDVIFLDLSMPIMDGWQFLDRFSEISPKMTKNIKIYICSSSISPDDITKAKLRETVNDFIIKPLDLSKLKNMLSIR